jgi:hypothetical protein
MTKRIQPKSATEAKDRTAYSIFHCVSPIAGDHSGEIHQVTYARALQAAIGSYGSEEGTARLERGEIIHTAGLSFCASLENAQAWLRILMRQPEPPKAGKVEAA